MLREEQMKDQQETSIDELGLNNTNVVGPPASMSSNVAGVLQLNSFSSNTSYAMDDTISGRSYCGSFSSSSSNPNLLNTSSSSSMGLMYDGGFNPVQYGNQYQSNYSNSGSFSNHDRGLVTSMPSEYSQESSQELSADLDLTLPSPPKPTGYRVSRMFDSNPVQQQFNPVQAPFNPVPQFNSAAGYGYANPAQLNPFDLALTRGGTTRVQIQNNHMMSAGGFGGGSGQQAIYQVQFKTLCKFFVPGSQLLNNIQIGEFVIVEADRGEDLGVVTLTLSMSEFMERNRESPFTDPSMAHVRRIIRIASLQERQLLATKSRDEQNVLQYARQLAIGTHNLPMAVLEAEYQFDRHKLTIYYDSSNRIDFRELVRDLFAAYKARIWMQKLNPQYAQLEPSATVALATGVQFNL